jgi:2-oxoglutarate ferredoxin oxidoreductase subunit delta
MGKMGNKRGTIKIRDGRQWHGGSGDMAGVKFYIDLCKGCKLCTTACPKGIVSIDGDTLNSKGFHPATVKREDMGKCVGCAFCATICPDCAIEVER